MSHIVIEEGYLKKRFRVLPISLVAQATTGDVYLGIDDAQLASYPDYEPGRGPALDFEGKDGHLFAEGAAY